MAHASHMPQLAPDLAARGVDRIGHLFPSIDLGFGMDTRSCVVAMCLRRDRGGFTEKNVSSIRSGTLGVVLGHHGVGHIAGHAGSSARERCEVKTHDHLEVEME